MGDAPGELADRLHLLRLPKLLLHLLAAGKVAHEAGEDPLSVGARFADGELDRKDRSVLGQALHQPAVADDSRFAGSEIIGDVAVVLGPVGLGHQHADVVAEHFLRMIAEQFRRRGAERGHEALLVDHDHRLGDGFEDRTQVRFARREVRLGALQAGDVVVVLQDEADGAVVGFAGDPEARDRDARPGLRLVFELALPAAALPQRRDDRAPRRRKPGLEQILDQLPDGLVGAPAVEALAAGRPVEDPAFQVMNDDVGEVENIGERGEFGVHCQSPLFLLVVTRVSLLARLGQATLR